MNAGELSAGVRPTETDSEDTDADFLRDGGDLDAGTNEGYGDMRVAVLVPYSGKGLPLWFDAFTDLASASGDLVDWIIFCEEVRPFYENFWVLRYLPQSLHAFSAPSA